MKKSIYALLMSGMVLFGCQSNQTVQTDEEGSEEASAQQEPAAPTLVGAWEITSSINSEGEDNTPYRSIIIYTDNFYSIEIATEDRPSWPEAPEGEDPADEHIINAYNGLISNSGRYHIEGDSIIHDVIVAKYPNFMNDWPRSAVAFSLDGDQMTTTGNWGNFTFRRLQ